MNKTEAYIDNNFKQHYTTKELSRGGQGVVFRTTDSELAVKLEINPDTGETVSDNDGIKSKKYTDLRLLPIPANTNVTLPLAALKGQAGYIMRLLNDMLPFEKAFDTSEIAPAINKWIESLIKDAPECAEMLGKYIASGGVKHRLNAYMKAACYLAKLHSAGLVYCDISPNNMFISSDSNSSNVWLIDADNINFQKSTRKNGYYTNGYGAPEVIHGDGCTFYSDCYALTVSLFWQTTGTHPFKGALLEAVDDEADFADDSEQKAYNGEFPWIGDLEDSCNTMLTQIPHENIFGKKMLDLFQQMFSKKGRTIPESRPSMFQLAEQFAKAHDEAVKCPDCEMEYNYFEQDCCPWCDAKLPPVLIVTSCYKNSTKTEVWKFVFVLTNQLIKIPKHVVSGSPVADIDKYAFNFTVCDKYVLKNLQEFTKVVVAESNHEIYGSYETSDKKFSLAVGGNISKVVTFEVLQ